MTLPFKVDVGEVVSFPDADGKTDIEGKVIYCHFLEKEMWAVKLDISIWDGKTVK